MKYRRLPHTDIDVSTIAMGCWGYSGGEWWGDQDESDAEAAILTSLDLGINFFDTAPAYGRGYSESLLGRVLERQRSKAVIATKVSPHKLSADDVVASVETSLERLRTDYIDLLQIHWPARKVPLEETLGAMERLRQAGKVRALGISNFGPGNLAELEACGIGVATNQVAHSLLFRAVEFEVQPICLERRLGILSYSPLAQGLLAGKFAEPQDVPKARARTRHFPKEPAQASEAERKTELLCFETIGQVRDLAAKLGVEMAHLALAWCIHQDGVTSVLAGARNAAQAKSNAAAAELELDRETLQALAGATAALKDDLGSLIDPWGRDSEPARLW